MRERWPCGTPNAQSRFSAETATRASSPSSGCTVTPRSTPSSKAPRRSRGSSSRVPSQECRSADRLGSQTEDPPGVAVQEELPRLVVELQQIELGDGTGGHDH